MDRESRSTRSVIVDFKVPINSELLMKEAKGCFGYLWDLRTTECSKCADRDVCGIVFNDTVVKPTTEMIQDEMGSIYLDLTDFKNATPDKIVGFIKSGETAISDLVSHVGALALTSDRVATVEFLKRFIKANSNIYTKEGIVWLR